MVSMVSLHFGSSAPADSPQWFEFKQLMGEGIPGFVSREGRVSHRTRRANHGFISKQHTISTWSQSCLAILSPRTTCTSETSTEEQGSWGIYLSVPVSYWSMVRAGRRRHSLALPKGRQSKLLQWDRTSHSDAGAGKLMVLGTWKRWRTYRNQRAYTIITKNSHGSHSDMNFKWLYKKARQMWV